jgi:hypothetical protein
MKVDEDTKDIKVAPRTLSSWLKKLGFVFESAKKNRGYTDGHEHRITKAARKEYLELMRGYRARMPKFTGRHMETVVWPKLKPGEKFVIWLVHDESCFCTDGGPVKVWIESGHTYLTPKRGSTIHVSGIISPFGLEHEVTIEPGKSAFLIGLCRFSSRVVLAHILF